jgi:alanine dehydrogenase
MTIGVPKEIKMQEHRVGLVPHSVSQLVKLGHRIVVERGAGIDSGYPDKDYATAGATLIDSHEAAFDCDLVVKVKEPIASEFPFLRKGQLLFSFLHLAANRELTDALLKSGVTALAYETVTCNLRRPLLEPMSEIAGRVATIVGAHFLAKPQGGGGVLLGGVPGVLPGRVVILGGGTSGINAAQMAIGLGADTTILEVDMERMRFIDLTMSGVRTLYSSSAHLTELLPTADLIIGAVLVPGAKAPKLLTREMLKLMKPGSVFVDIAIDQGGCAETSRPTSHDDPVYVEEGVLHYCVTNMPGAYARTATQALTNATYPYIEALAQHGLAETCRRHAGLAEGVNVKDGRISYRAVADALGMPYEKFTA